MQKLRANAKATAGRGQPPRPSPAAAPVTPAANVPVVVYPGTYQAGSTRPIGAAETAAEIAAGKKPVARPTIQKTAEASASDAARFTAMKFMAGSSLDPQADSAYDEPFAILKTMRAGTNAYYTHMQSLFGTLQKKLEVILSHSPRALWRLKGCF